jgi:hypothetical protein
MLVLLRKRFDACELEVEERGFYILSYPYFILPPTPQTINITMFAKKHHLCTSPITTLLRELVHLCLFLRMIPRIDEHVEYVRLNSTGHIGGSIVTDFRILLLVRQARWREDLYLS